MSRLGGRSINYMLSETSLITQPAPTLHRQRYSGSDHKDSLRHVVGHPAERERCHAGLEENLRRETEEDFAGGGGGSGFAAAAAAPRLWRSAPPPPTLGQRQRNSESSKGRRRAPCAGRDL